MLQTISFILKHSDEALLYVSESHRVEYDICEKIADTPDKYGRRKLYKDSDIVNSFSSFWNNIGYQYEVIVYLKFDEDTLNQIFSQCSYPHLLRISSPKRSKIKSMKNKVSNDSNLLGIYLNTEHERKNFFIIGGENLLKLTFDLALDSCDWSLSPM